MIEDFDGADVIDASGEKIGTVERSYVDDQGSIQLVEVKMGGFLAKHRLVPLDAVGRTDQGLTVPYARDVVEGSPDASSAGDTLEGALLDEVRAYYAGGTAVAPPAVPASQVQPGGASEAEVAGGGGEATFPESGAVTSETPGGLDAGQMGQIRDLGDVIEVPIVEEELVKRPVVKEVLRIRKSALTEQQRVGGEVRKEDIEVNREGDTVG